MAESGPTPAAPAGDDSTHAAAEGTPAEPEAASVPQSAGGTGSTVIMMPTPPPAAAAAAAAPKPEEEDSPEQDERHKDSGTDATAESAVDDGKRGNGTAEASAPSAVVRRPSSAPVVSSTKKTRPPYKFDPSKITLRFLFANRDGLTVTVECDPSDTVADVKKSLLSVWPEGLPDCSGGDNLRLVCMGRGYLTPDTRTLEECQIPTFKTHPTPVNVSIRPEASSPTVAKGGAGHDVSSAGGNRVSSAPSTDAAGTSQGCTCVML